jgi:hypothetical protein
VHSLTRAVLVHKSPNFRLMLRRPVKPKNRAPIVTLGDAIFFIEQLDAAVRAHAAWYYARGVVMGAARTGEEADIIEATRALEAALRDDNG